MGGNEDAWTKIFLCISITQKDLHRNLRLKSVKRTETKESIIVYSLLLRN